MKSALLIVLTSVTFVGCSGAPDEQGPVPEGYDMPLGPTPDRDEWEAAHPELAQPPAGEGEKSCFSRADHSASVQVHAGIWGSWNSCFDLCPINSFAYGVNVKSEDYLNNLNNGGDDTAVNAISFHCFNRFSGAFTDFVESTQQGWGTWQGGTGCNGLSNPIEGVNLKLEASHNGDDTAADQISITCNAAPNLELLVPSNAHPSWGTFRGLKKCPTGTQVCGIKTRVEGFQGNSDDTALNSLSLACCNF